MSAHEGRDNTAILLEAARDDADYRASIREFFELIGNVPIRFWTCPIEHPPWPPRVTVRWEGDVAYCTEPGCGRTSAEPAPAHEALIRACVTHMEQVAQLADTFWPAAWSLAQDCPDCLTTDPATGEWVSCPSNAAPR